MLAPRDIFDLFMWLTHKVGWGWAVSAILGVTAIRLWFVKRGMARVYQNRNDLNSASGGLSQELESVRQGWVMWPVGGSSVSLSKETLAHIERLILRDPNKRVAWYAKHFIAGSEEILSSAVVDLTKRAQNAGVAVRWNADFDLSIIISDHISDKAWARIELLLPGIESAYRPSIMIRKNSHADLFKILIKMFEYAWNDSVKPPS